MGGMDRTIRSVRSGMYHQPHYHGLCQKLCDMKRRCGNMEDKNYYLYGARGIRVCDEWTDPIGGHLNFYLWSIDNGYERGASIDRINNDGDYSPENCRWATAKEQANNRRTNRVMEIYGETKTVTEWARIAGVDPDTALRRFRKKPESLQVFDLPRQSTRRRAVVRLDDMKEYESLREAARDISGCPDKISMVCRGIRPHHMGFRFAFTEDGA